jgi:hypothetical protein
MVTQEEEPHHQSHWHNAAPLFVVHHFEEKRLQPE